MFGILCSEVLESLFGKGTFGKSLKEMMEQTKQTTQGKER